MSFHQPISKNSILCLVGLIILTLCLAYYCENIWSEGVRNQKLIIEQNMTTIVAKLKTESESDKLINLFSSQNEYIQSQDNMIISMFSFIKTVTWIVLIWLLYHLFSLNRHLKRVS